MPDSSACVSDFPNSILYDLAEYHLRFLVIIHYLLHRTVRKKKPKSMAPQRVQRAAVLDTVGFDC